MAKKQKLPVDANRRAKKVLDIITSEEKEDAPSDKIKQAAFDLGRLGGLKGGAARAKALTKKERSDIAKKAAAARWAKYK